MDSGSAVMRGRCPMRAGQDGARRKDRGKGRESRSARGRPRRGSQGGGSSAAAGAADGTLPFPEIRPQVLFVDDNVNFCTGLRFPMERRGLGLTSARDSEQALELLRLSSFDVALVDWKLDGSRLDGLELLKRIRTTYHNLPIVFITAFDNKEIQRDSQQAGADAYLVKDGDSEGLCDVVEALAVRGRSRGPWLALGRRMDELGVSLSDLGEPMCKVLAKMCTSLGQRLRRADLAECTGLSKDRFSKRFKQDMGIGWKQFLMEFQVETAQELLHDPSLSISEVATRAGFGNLKNMESAFRKVIGLTPTEFRKRLKNS